MATERTQTGAANVQEALTNLGQNKRMVIAGAAVITLILTFAIIIFVWSKGASQGSSLDLVTRIDQGRAFEIVSKLKSDQIETKIVNSDLPGKVNIQVFEKQFDKAALTLARSDLLQEDGYSLFDKSDWAASDYDKRVKMTRAINGDLSRIVSRMEGVKWATVRINLPEQELFSNFETASTATVQIETAVKADELSRPQIKSIINLLIGYVPNLQSSNISIIDTKGETYSTVETEDVVASDVLEETEKVNKLIEKRIESYLEPLLGARNYIVKVSAEISRQRIEESSTSFAEGVIGQEQIGDERLGAGQGGVAGAIAGIAAAGQGDKAYSRLNKVIQRYPSYKQTSVSTPPGSISKVSVAIAIDRGLPAGVSVKQLREGIAAIASPNANIDDVKITVAEFARSTAVQSKHKEVAPGATAATNIWDKVTLFFSNIANYFKKAPLWVSIPVVIISIFVFFSFLGSLFRPNIQSPAKNIAQIDTESKQQLEELQKQITEQKAGPEQLEQELTGVLSGFQEAASQKPEFLAGRLQVWLEEGSPSVH